MVNVRNKKIFKIFKLRQTSKKHIKLDKKRLPKEEPFKRIIFEYLL